MCCVIVHFHWYHLVTIVLNQHGVKWLLSTTHVGKELRPLPQHVAEAAQPRCYELQLPQAQSGLKVWKGEHLTGGGLLDDEKEISGPMNRLE